MYPLKLVSYSLFSASCRLKGEILRWPIVRISTFLLGNSWSIIHRYLGLVLLLKLLLLKYYYYYSKLVLNPSKFPNNQPYLLVQLVPISTSDDRVQNSLNIYFGQWAILYTNMGTSLGAQFSWYSHGLRVPGDAWFKNILDQPGLPFNWTSYRQFFFLK